jgi:hypothetical protein
MSILKFSDGISIDTSGPLRVLELSDGFYVTGGGVLIPVQSREKALEVIQREEIIFLSELYSLPLSSKTK